MMKIKNWQVLLVMACATLAGCNKVDDVQPPDTDLVPVTAVAAVKKRYPNAADLAFETCLKGEIWIADFSANTHKLRTYVNKQEIISAVYEKLPADFAFYQSFTDRLSIQGGTFSDLMAYEGDTSSARLMKYKLNGRLYTLEYKYDASTATDRLMLLGPESSATMYAAEAELPQPARDFFRKEGLSVSASYFTVGPDGTKTYMVYSQGYAWPYYFDEAGNLQWTMKSNNAAATKYNMLNENLGYPALLGQVNPIFSGFDKPSYESAVTDYSGVVSLRYTFQKDRIMEMGAFESGEVYFNAKTGRLLSDSYRAVVSR